jgi:peptidoglycan/LPS O-acetylase OafA/YrhL
MSAAATEPPAAARAAPDAVAPPPGHPRFPLFDSIRGIGAIAVVVSHAGYFSGASQDAWYGPFIANGGIGVTMFFVLSGFLLYRPFVAADLDGAPRIALRDFARRRALRIVPAYWLALTILAIYPGLKGVFTGDWWVYYGFLQIYVPGAPAQGLAAAWSLDIELSFYLLLPLYAWVMRRVWRSGTREQRIRRELVALGALALASIAVRTVSLESGGSVLELTLAGTFDWLAAGMALAVLSVGPAPRALTGFVSRRAGLIWTAAVALYLLMCLVLRTTPGTPLQYTQGQWIAQHLFVGAISALLVLPAVWGRGGWPRRVLAWRWLGGLGVISYGVYLWQGGWVLELWRRGAREWIPSSPFIVLTVGTFAGSVLCALVSYRLVERPLMRHKDARRRRPATRGTAVAAGSARAPGPGTAPGSPR